MQGNSRIVVSSQEGPHEKLEAVLIKHIAVPFRKPVLAHTRQAFEHADDLVLRRNKPLILDSGCGTGESTIFLAQKYPTHFVLGLDKSTVRLRKAEMKEQPDNMIFVRADQFDFWRLVAESSWPVEAHFVFYPNPWPKKGHLARRIHGHPSFPAFAKLGDYIEVRSNWKIYLDEMAFALDFVSGRKSQIDVIKEVTPHTLFEKKYAESGQALFRLLSADEGAVPWI